MSLTLSLPPLILHVSRTPGDSCQQSLDCPSMAGTVHDHLQLDQRPLKAWPTTREGDFTPCLLQVANGMQTVMDRHRPSKDCPGTFMNCSPMTTSLLSAVTKQSRDWSRMTKTHSTARGFSGTAHKIFQWLNGHPSVERVFTTEWQDTWALNKTPGH